MYQIKILSLAVIVLLLSGSSFPLFDFVKPALGQSDFVNLSTACVNGLQVDINGGTSSSGVSNISWNWGDGQTTTGFFPESHTYSTAGTYVIKVTSNYNDGSSASASQTVTVAQGDLANCDDLTINTGTGGSVSYSASVGSGTVQAGSSKQLYLDYADDLNLAANPSNGYSFSSWTTSGTITGFDSQPVSQTPNTSIVVGSNGQISANFLTASTFPIVFTESGLPSDTSWSVTLNGNIQTSTSSSITFNEPDGNYQFSVTPPPSYSVVPYSGTLTVNGNPVSQPLTFVPPVQESGSTPVSMSFTGTVSGPITNMQMTLTTGTVTAGGTTYSVSGSPGQYCNQNNVVCNSPNGVLSAGSIQLPNGLVMGLASCYTQTSNNQISLSFYNGKPNTCGGTTAITQGFDGPVLCALNATGTLVVSGSQATITASGTGNCNIPTGTGGTSSNSVTFTESGLPSGSEWQVTLGPYTQQSTSTNPTEITFMQIPSSTYTYSASSAEGGYLWQTSQQNPEVVVPASNMINLSFGKISTFSPPSSPGILTATIANNPLQIAGQNGGCQGQTTMYLSNTGGSALTWNYVGANTGESITPSPNYEIQVLSTINPPISLNPSSGTIEPDASSSTPVTLSVNDGACAAGTTQSYTFGMFNIGTGKTEQQLKFSYTNTQTVSSGSGSQGTPMQITGSLTNDMNDNYYNLTLTFTPNAASLLFFNNTEINEIVNNILDQDVLETSSNTQILASVQTSSDSTNQIELQILEALMSAPTVGANIAKALIQVGGTEGLVLSSIVMAEKGPLPILPNTNPLNIVVNVVNDYLDSATSGVEECILYNYFAIVPNGVNACPAGSKNLQMNQQPYTPDYLVGGSSLLTSGQELNIIITKLTKVPNNNFNLNIAGTNGLMSGISYIQTILDTSGLSTITVPPASFTGTLNFNDCVTVSGHNIYCGDYDIPTTTVQDPETAFINVNTANLELQNINFNSSSSVLSANALISSPSTSATGNINIFIPQLINPINSTDFVLTLDNNNVPYAESFVKGKGYALNATLTEGGLLDLQLPRIETSLVLAVENTNVIISGSGYASNSQIITQYWNNTGWENFMQTSSSANGEFFTILHLPIVGSSTMFVKAIDSDGNVGISSVSVPVVPVVTGTPNRSPNTNGWYDKPVTINWSGFSSSTQPISCDSPVTYSGPDGKNITITGHCSNSFGTGMDNVTINYDSTPPEVYIEFNSTTKDVSLYGNDSLSGIPTNPIFPTSIVPAKWDDGDNKFRHDNDTGDAQIRTYDIVDRAGNTLKLVEKVMLHGNEIKVHIVNLQYNNGSIVSAGKNEEKFEWSTDKNGNIKELEQHIMVGQGKNRQDVDAKYSLKDNKTGIDVDNQSEHKNKITEAGLVLLHVATNQGNLLVNGY